MDQLQKQLDELRKRRQEIIQKRNAELEAIKELKVSPEPEIVQDHQKKSKSNDVQLSFARPVKDISFNPVQHAVYTRATQADLMPDPVVVEKKPDVHLSIDDESQTTFDYVVEDNIIAQNDVPTISFGPTSDYEIIWSHSKQVDTRKVPTAIDWSGSTFATALRHFASVGEGIVSIRNAKTPDNATEVRVPSQPTTVKFVPRSTDMFIVGTISGLIFLYDKRAQDTPVAQTQRWNSCHYAQIVSTIFTVQRRFLSIAADGSIYSWDIDSLSSCLSKDPLPNSSAQMVRPTAACLNDLGKVIIGFEDGKVASRSINKEAPLETIATFNGPITGMSFRQSSRGYRSALAVSSLDCNLSVFSGEKKTKEYTSITDAYLGCEWRPAQSPVLATLRSDGRVLIYDITQNDERSVELPAMGCCSAFSAEGNMLCVGCIDSTIHLINCP